MAAVERNGVHAALLGQLRAVGNLALDLVDAVDGEDFAGIIGIFAGGRRGSARRDGRLAAVVDQLDGDAHVIAVQPLGQMRPAGDMLAVEEDGRLYVAVDGETCTMPACTSFRGFLPFADKISLALGYRYLYTYIMPVAAEGNADFSAILGGIFGYNTGTGCCNIREKGV